MKKVLVIFGGKSSEHDVSTVSACSVINNIPKDKYEVLMLGITKDGKWLLYKGEPNELPEDEWLKSGECTPAFISPDSSVHGIMIVENGGLTTEYIDVVFPVLHGKNGEDGTIQGLLQLSGIPYVGCDSASSAVCMDKALTNTVADANGIPQAAWVKLLKYDYHSNKGLVDKIIETLGFPIFVKPANAGSSVGISKAKDRQDLICAIEKAFMHDDKLVLEEGIDAIEVECAIMGNDKPIASVVGEIAPCNEFYDFDAKYIKGTTELFIPARIDKEKSEEIRAAAIYTFKSLGCSGISRVDFFIRKSDNAVLFNEINTIPGFTSISMYPKMFEASGIAYSELLDGVINLAVEKWSEKKI